MIDQELLKKERKQWRENSLLQSKAILTTSKRNEPGTRVLVT